MKRALTVAMVALALVLGGCQTAPTTPKQNVYAAAAMYAATARTTTDLLRSGAISVEQAKSVQETLHKFRPALRLAREAVEQGKPVPEDAMRQIRDMRRALNKIQAELEKEKPQ